MVMTNNTETCVRARIIALVCYVRWLAYLCIWTIQLWWHSRTSCCTLATIYIVRYGSSARKCRAARLLRQSQDIRFARIYATTLPYKNNLRTYNRLQSDSVSFYRKNVIDAILLLCAIDIEHTLKNWRGFENFKPRILSAWSCKTFVKLKLKIFSWFFSNKVKVQSILFFYLDYLVLRVHTLNGC